MKYQVIMCLLLVLGCGGEGTNDLVIPTKYILCDVTNPPSPAIEEEEETIYVQRPHMYFSPRQLMFYYDSATIEFPLAPHTIRVCNATDEVVTILDAYVSNVDNIYGGENNRNYFILSPIELPQYIVVDECLSMDVTFVYSSRQRGAQLVVHTSFNSFEEMTAPLSGKVFFF